MNVFKNRKKANNQNDSDSSTSYITQHSSSTQNSSTIMANNTQATAATATTTTANTTPFWKLSSGRNGEKYLIFPSTVRRSSQSYFDEQPSVEGSSNLQTRTYKMRWFILLVIGLVQLSNAINWISYSPIADYTSKFYNVDYNYINYLSLVYMVIAIPAGLASFFLIDYFGIRFSINFAGWLNFIGAIIRVLSSIDKADGSPLIPLSSKYTVLMIGQVLCAMAQPFVMFITTKFANAWFAQDQRALANTLALSANTFGILIGAFISPFIVDSEVKFVSEMGFLNLITAGLSLPCVVLAGFINRSVPQIPPSISASKNNSNENEKLTQKAYLVLAQIGKLMKSGSFLILCMCFGLGLGSFSTLTTLIEQIICVRGYTDDDAGIFGGALIMSGILGSLVFGLIVDKTKKFEEIGKICFSFSSIANIIFVIIQQYDNDNGVLKYSTLLSFVIMGFFGLALLPVCMEMSVECMYPIAEDIPSGLLFMVGQIFGVLMILLYPTFGTTVATDSYVYESVQQCTSKNSTLTLSVISYNGPLYFQTGLLVIVSIIFVAFFKCPYLRLQIEREKLAEEILNTTRQPNIHTSNYY